jgi:hypothetical protein
MAHLTVVGAGVAGSALTRIAKERGHHVRLVADDTAYASHVALAIVRPSYASKDPNGRLACEFSLEEYRKAGCQIVEGAEVSTWMRTTPKLEKDWWSVDPLGYLLEPDEYDHVERDWVDPNTEFTIHATGHALDEGSRTFGYTWMSLDPGALSFRGLRVYHFAPYRTVDGVSYDRGCRLGSSVARTKEAARAQAHKQFEIARRLGWIVSDDWLVYGGERGYRENVAQREAERRWSLGGFHRSGWSLAPFYAARVIEEVERAAR